MADKLSRYKNVRLVPFNTPGRNFYQLGESFCDGIESFRKKLFIPHEVFQFNFLSDAEFTE